MKGNIYPTKYGWQVRFGRKLSRHFTDLRSAERFLNGIRYETDKGTFDIRDYQKHHPLGFTTLADKWLNIKRSEVKEGSFSNLYNYMTKAVKEWGQRNIKTIGYGEFQDFFLSQSHLASKTRANIRSCLHDFFTWAERRERIPMPDIPEVSFELGWRNIIDIETQQKIIGEVWEISGHINPKIWFGIRCLATYISCRPIELLGIKEKRINRKGSFIAIPHPKEKQPKLVYLLDDDMDILNSFPPGLPDLYFFRHTAGIQGCKAGRKFGDRYLYRWWKRACDNLGIEGVDLYGGTRHSTVTALGKVCTPEEVQDATGHASKAFRRYFQGKQARAIKVTERVKELSGTNQPLINISGGLKNIK